MFQAIIRNAFGLSHGVIFAAYQERTKKISYQTFW